MPKSILKKFKFPKELQNILKNKDIIIPESRDELIKLSLGNKGSNYFEVEYDVPGIGKITEATVALCKNGVVVNYMEEYLRRRDPDSMVIADDGESDKIRFKEKYGEDFEPLRERTFQWLNNRNLILMPFMSGGETFGYPSLLVAPENAGFFAAGLADLQGFIPKDEILENFKPRAIVYLAPPFRHTHFNKKQIVVHNRRKDIYEIFAYNLYPGPSAKKGIYGVLLTMGEKEGWLTAHASTVRVITPYENIFTIMHEGASGGGKSEMTERLNNEIDGRILLGKHLFTGKKYYLELKEACELQPVTDDMALCPPALQNGTKRLVLKDAENGWFLRTDHIKKYGTDSYLESLCIHPEEPLIFLNYHGVPGSTCLIWEHTMDTPEKPCPNPRVIMPRRFIPNIVNEPVEIDIRSFGIRTPPCTKVHPTYGIIGLFHVLPPALAWLWRLVSPRGHDNPSITDTIGMSSEGVGSYWPFATGKMIDQANLLLKQILNTSNTRYILIPNQHIGVYKVGFMPQWIAREYLARRGSARFRSEQLIETGFPLLGYSLDSIKVDGTYINKEFLDVRCQVEVGEEGFNAGAKLLSNFFKKELANFSSARELHPIGKKVIDCCMSDGTLSDYTGLIPMKL